MNGREHFHRPPPLSSGEQRARNRDARRAALVLLAAILFVLAGVLALQLQKPATRSYVTGGTNR